MTSKGYTTKQEIENYLLITIDETFESQIDEWISQIEEHIDKMTGRNFVADSIDSERVYDGDGTDNILIDDCVSVEAIEVGETELETTEYKLYPANTIPKKKIVYTGRFYKGDQNITVNAKWGYSVVAPGDIKLAATVLVAGIINYAWKGEGEVQQTTIGRYSVTYKSEKQWQDFEKVKEILTYYQKQIV